MFRFLMILYLLAYPFLLFPQGLKFVVLGDNRPSSATKEQPKVFLSIIQKVNKISPAFVLSTGDIIAGYVNDETLIKTQLHGFLEVLADLKAPFYNALGNHDVFGNPQALLLYKKYLQMPGNGQYYSFNDAGCHFVCLDTEEIGKEGRITGSQLDWLKKDLKKNKNSLHIFSFFHRPLFPVAEHIGQSLDEFPEERQVLIDLFNKYKVKYVFVGHEHLYAEVKKDGIVQYITGGAGAPIRADKEQGGFNNFLVVSVSNTSVRVDMVRVDGD